MLLLIFDDSRAMRCKSECRIHNSPQPVKGQFRQRMSGRASQLYLAIRGHYLDFDDHGAITVPASELRAVSELVHVGGEIELQRADDPTVVRADHYRRIKELKGELEWKPSKNDLEAITIDLLGPSRPKGAKAVPILKANRAAVSELPA